MKRSIRTAAAGRRQQRRGFTLIELLVVVAIIALLAGVGISSFARLRGQARESLSEVLLEGVRTGLEMYKADTMEYPESDFASYEGNRTKDYLTQIDDEKWYGCQILTQAMLGYLDAKDGLDGHDGYGFRNRPRGKVFGPYIDAKVHTADVPTGAGSTKRAVLLDGFDNPILYYRFDEDGAEKNYVGSHNLDNNHPDVTGGGPDDGFDTLGPHDDDGDPIIEDYSAEYVKSSTGRKYLLITPGMDKSYGQTPAGSDDFGKDDLTSVVGE